MPNKGAGNGGVTYPSPNEWPTTVFPITGITQAGNATITANGTGITILATQSTPRVDFTQVKGMSQINGQSAFVTKVINPNQFVVALDTSQYSPYTSGGFVNLIVSPQPVNPLTNTFQQEIPNG